MKRIPSPDSWGAPNNSMCPPQPTDEHSPRSESMYSREFQSMLDGFDDECGLDEAGHGSSKKRRLRIDQVKALEKNFEVENKLEPDRKVKLAQELGLQPRQVAVWFQNRRARWKTKQLERDFGVLKANYNSLKVNYDTLKHDNEALLKEIKELKSKLDQENSTESNISIKEEEVFMPDTGKSYVDEIGLRASLLVSRINAETKDGSSDSDSSAIVNDESNSSPSRAISSSTAVHTIQLEKASLFVPTAQYVKTEERDFFVGDEACNFFADDQAPSLHWYCPDQWN
ncbi:hypothetical protein MLD38_009305 [Melastoma candidum]|uniref:Uncharacterized protein n=1 Tax=Melastoma candidum TaxID=119954 RepID=A0ACB9RZ09_9MYRT|nr:hypothetical protein MLD38_009305 [Melastoma candidum]